MGKDAAAAAATAAKPNRSAEGISIIAQPLAGKKLTKKALKIVKRASKDKKVRRGVKEVQKALRKKQVGACIIAGDISPIDVISHLPILCEDHDIPYVYVPSKADLGSAGSTKRPTSCVMVVPGDGWEHKELYDEVVSMIKEATPSSWDT